MNCIYSFPYILCIVQYSTRTLVQHKEHTTVAVQCTVQYMYSTVCTSMYCKLYCTYLCTVHYMLIAEYYIKIK